jgi:hypothetical protein
MKTMTMFDDSLVHVIGAINQDADPGFASLRTMCGEYYYCRNEALADGDHTPTCVPCVAGIAEWVMFAKTIGASTVERAGDRNAVPLKVL